MAKPRTHYDNLQVTTNASPEVIRAAYKTLTQQHHPDRNPESRERAERIMKALNEAYRVLSDPHLRAKHDAWIESQTFIPPQGASSSSPEREPQPQDCSPPDQEQRADTDNAAKGDMLGMRWYTFWTLFSLPVGAMFNVIWGMLTPSPKPPMGEQLDAFSNATILAQLPFAVAVIQLITCIGLWRRQRFGWDGNWIVLLLTCVVSPLAVAWNQPIGSERNVSFDFGLVVFGAGMLIPSFVYWKKRKHLFPFSSPNLSGNRRFQWTAIPVFAWIALIFLIFLH